MNFSKWWIFSNRLLFSGKTAFLKISADFAENTDFSKKKSAVEKNPPFWNIRIFFFMDLRFRNWTYIQTRFWLKNCHATSSSQARFVCCIFVNLISISCRNNNEQIRYLFLSICSLSIGHLFDKRNYFISSLF